MTSTGDIRVTALAVLGRIAPDADLETLDPAAPLQEELDLDSFDFLQFVEGLSLELGVEVSERDYPKIASLDGCVAHVAALLQAQPSPARDG